MQLHNNSGNITVIIDVSIDERYMFKDLILNEQAFNKGNHYVYVFNGV